MNSLLGPAGRLSFLMTTLFFLTVFLSIGYNKAYLVTSPVANEFWYIGEPKTLRWSSVESDPALLSIAISNQDAGTYPSALSRMVRKGIPKKQGQYRLPASTIRHLKEGSGYQLNIMSPEGGAILAQSPIFTISRDEEGSRDPVDNDDEDEDIDLVDADDGGDPMDNQSTRASGQHHDQHHVTAEKDKLRVDANNKHHKVHPDPRAHHSHKKASAHSRKRLQRAKSKSDALFKSTPKFERNRGVCSRSPRNPRLAKIVRA